LTSAKQSVIINEMKTISIRNPIGYLIAAGIKDVENRSWATKYRGPLLIHSSGDEDIVFLEWQDIPKKLHDKEKNKEFWGLMEKYRKKCVYPF